MLLDHFLLVNNGWRFSSKINKYINFEPKVVCPFCYRRYYILDGYRNSSHCNSCKTYFNVMQDCNNFFYYIIMFEYKNLRASIKSYNTGLYDLSIYEGIPSRNANCLFEKAGIEKIDLFCLVDFAKKYIDNLEFL